MRQIPPWREGRGAILQCRKNGLSGHEDCWSGKGAAIDIENRAKSLAGRRREAKKA